MFVDVVHLLDDNTVQYNGACCDGVVRSYYTTVEDFEHRFMVKINENECIKVTK